MSARAGEEYFFEFLNVSFCEVEVRRLGVDRVLVCQGNFQWGDRIGDFALHEPANSQKECLDRLPAYLTCCLLQI